MKRTTRLFFSKENPEEKILKNSQVKSFFEKKNNTRRKKIKQDDES